MSPFCVGVEVDMPWSYPDNIPRPAKNWSETAQKKCVSAANAAKAKDASDADCIYACIRAAGKSKSEGSDTDVLTPEELTALMPKLQEMGFAFVTLGGTPTEFEVEFDDGRMVALGSVSPDIDFGEVRALYFRNAILAREERNKNRDRLPLEEVAALASSIGGMPIDDEHRLQDIIGVFTKGRQVQDRDKGAVSTDGVIWAQRFPTIARQIVNGERALSMEVYMASATCSLCGGTYTSSKDYCSHLLNHESDRILHGVLGFGGAATRRPAGTDTIFDPDRMVVVASAHAHTQQADDDTTSGGTTDMELTERVKELEVQVETLEGSNAQLTTDLATAQEELGTVQQALAKANEGNADLVWSLRSQRLAQAGVDEDEVKEKQEVLAGLSDDAFDFMMGEIEKAHAQATTDDDDDDDDDQGDDDPKSKTKTVGSVDLGSNDGDGDNGDDGPMVLVLD